MGKNVEAYSNVDYWHILLVGFVLEIRLYDSITIIICIMLSLMIRWNYTVIEKSYCHSCNTEEIEIFETKEIDQF